MRTWTKILPAFIWLWYVRRNCEKWTVRQPITARIAQIGPAGISIIFHGDN